MGGTNAHVVLEEAPARLPLPDPIAQPPQPRLLCLSAKSATALHELAAHYVEALERQPAADFADVCFTASAGRVHFAHRFAVMARQGAPACAPSRAVSPFTEQPGA